MNKCFQFYVRLKDTCGVDHDPKRAVNKAWQKLCDPIFLEHATPEEILKKLRDYYELFEFYYQAIQPPAPEDCPNKLEPESNWDEALNNLTKGKIK